MNIEHVLQIQIEGENYPSAGSRARQMFGTRAWVAEAGNGQHCSGENYKINTFFRNRFMANEMTSANGAGDAAQATKVYFAY